MSSSSSSSSSFPSYLSSSTSLTALLTSTTVRQQQPRKRRSLQTQQQQLKLYKEELQEPQQQQQQQHKLQQQQRHNTHHQQQQQHRSKYQRKRSPHQSQHNDKIFIIVNTDIYSYVRLPQPSLPPEQQQQQQQQQLANQKQTLPAHTTAWYSGGGSSAAAGGGGGGGGGCGRQRWWQAHTTTQSLVGAIYMLMLFISILQNHVKTCAALRSSIVEQIAYDGNNHQSDVENNNNYLLTNLFKLLETTTTTTTTMVATTTIPSNYTFKSFSIIDELLAAERMETDIADMNDAYDVTEVETVEVFTDKNPIFDFGVPRNITGRNGQTEVVIKCRVDMLNDKSISWIRKRDLHILTVGTATYTNDKRFQVTESKDSREWFLHIKSPQPRDSGTYECQVNTEPKISMAFQLNIIEISPDTKAIISGPPDVYFKVGSAIILNCYVQQPTVKYIGPIYWYRGQHMITPVDRDAEENNNINNNINNNNNNDNDNDISKNYNDDILHSAHIVNNVIQANNDDDIDKVQRSFGAIVSDASVSEITPELTNEITDDFSARIAMESQLGDTLKTRLRIANAQKTDSGNYTCQPTTASSASVMVHVINDENPAAMQKSHAIAVHGSPTKFIAFIIICLCCYFGWSWYWCWCWCCPPLYRIHDDNFAAIVAIIVSGTDVAPIMKTIQIQVHYVLATIVVLVVVAVAAAAVAVSTDAGTFSAIIVSGRDIAVPLLMLFKSPNKRKIVHIRLNIIKTTFQADTISFLYKKSPICR